MDAEERSSLISSRQTVDRATRSRQAGDAQDRCSPTESRQTGDMETDSRQKGARVSLGDRLQTGREFGGNFQTDTV